MRILHSLLLVLTLGICYLLFFRSQTPVQPSPGAPSAKTSQAAGLDPEEQAAAASASHPHSQYKADMDKARTVANQMKAAHEEADSF